MRRFFVALAVLFIPAAANAAWDSAAIHDRGPQLLSGSLTVRGTVRAEELAPGDAGVRFPDNTRQTSAGLPAKGGRLTGDLVLAPDAGIAYPDGTRQMSAETFQRLTTGAVVLEGADAGVTFADGTRQASAALPKSGGTLTGDLVIAPDAGVTFSDGSRQTTAPPRWLNTERRRIRWDIQTASANVYAADNGASFTSTNHGTAAQIMMFGGPAFEYSSTTTSLDAYHGITLQTAATKWEWQPALSGFLGTPPAIGSVRGWWGLVGSTVLGVTLDGATAGAPALAALAWHTAVSPNWQCCSGNGTAYGCTDTGIPVATSTDYRLEVAVLTAAVECRVNGASTTRTTTIPTTGTAIIVAQHHNQVLGEKQPIRVGPYSLETR